MVEDLAPCYDQKLFDIFWLDCARAIAGKQLVDSFIKNGAEQHLKKSEKLMKMIANRQSHHVSITYNGVEIGKFHFAYEDVGELRA